MSSTPDAGPESSPPKRPGLPRYAAAWSHAYGRAAWKAIRSRTPGSANNADYQKHRFPGVNVATLRESTDRFAKLLGRFSDIEIRSRSEDVFELARRPASRTS